jgi:Periplasmic binding protein
VIAFRIGGVLVATLIAATACTAGDADDPTLVGRTPRGRPTASDTLVVGLVGTMTGDDAWRGEDAFEGADLAVHRLNTRLEEGEPPYELVTRDDQGLPGRALRQVRELAALPRTVGIVYAGPPQVLPRAERSLAATGIPTLLVYGDLYTARRLTPHIFQMAPALSWQARRIVTYLFDDRRYEKIGLIAGASFMGRNAAAALTEAAASQGVRVARVVRYRPDDPSLAAVLRRLRGARVEAVVVEGSPRVLSGVIQNLNNMDAAYLSTERARIASAPRRPRRARIESGEWHPQVVAFDEALSPRLKAPAPAGTISAESYGRGAHYLPVPSFRAFARAFMGWWDEPALGWQLRSYDAVRLIGWAYDHSKAGDDLAVELERVRQERFGGTEITLGPDDHTAVDASAVGLWSVPDPARSVPERQRLPAAVLADFPWVPLARGFSIDGDELDFSSRDWRYLVRGGPPPQAPPPRIGRLKFGIATGRTDPIH